MLRVSNRIELTTKHAILISLVSIYFMNANSRYMTVYRSTIRKTKQKSYVSLLQNSQSNAQQMTWIGCDEIFIIYSESCVCLPLFLLKTAEQTFFTVRKWELLSPHYVVAVDDIFDKYCKCSRARAHMCVCVVHTSDQLWQLNLKSTNKKTINTIYIVNRRWLNEMHLHFKYWRC